ncbi:hypothetical protein [Hymenobacter glacieicola]|uniref:Phage protein n=1 Tax=Hymenobacter glacieicola TaxID=1562124 RepID=A0ABQ1X6H4_9BACT|nr:hypothetical protein [Hymenobacter glacieicola]GGG61019.1 hypothetical protein GCM10011378_41290 [Hymenobacter glacieicola]
MKLADKKEQATTLGLAAIKSFKVVNRGIDTPDYFPGASIHAVKTAKDKYYTEVYTGIGSTPQEAYNDAVECASEVYDTAYLPSVAKDLKGETVAEFYERNGLNDDGETYCYVLLYVEEA